jgi:hypothetical protein
MVHGKLDESSGIAGTGFFNHLLAVGIDGMKTDKEFIRYVFAVMARGHERDNFQFPFTQGNGRFQARVVGVEDKTGFVFRG